MKESWSLKAHQKEKDGHGVAVDVPQWQRGYMKHIAAVIQLKGKSFTGCCVALHFSPSAAWWLLWAQGPQLERGFGHEESPVWLLNYSAMVQTSIQTSYTLNIKIWMADTVFVKMWASADILLQAISQSYRPILILNILINNRAT